MKKLILLGLLMYAVMSAPALATITILGQYPHPDGHYPTYQAWTFTTSPFTPPLPSLGGKDIPADVYQNPYGTPTADVVLTTGTGCPMPGWFDNLGNNHQGGIFGHSDTIDMEIPNIIETRYAYEKIVQVEVTYHVQAYQEGVHGYIDGSVTAGGKTYNPVSVDDKELVPGSGDGWRDVTITFSRFPQIYDSEAIHLYFVDSGVVIDSIEVATVCIPEPATLLLLGGAGLVGLLRRRRTI